MTLQDVIANIADFNDHSVIYAAKPWTIDSPAVVCNESKKGNTPMKAAGMEYFLEVAIVAECLQNWARGKNKTLEEIGNCLIYTAVYGA